MSMLINPFFGVLTTGYGNAGGTGNRTSIITVSATFLLGSAGTFSELVDGSQANSIWWASAAGDGSAWVLFDFATSKVIDEFKWYQDVTNSHGTWRFEGSPDNSAWTQCGSDFTLSGSTGGTVFSVPNSTAYRYYRLRHMSGSRSLVPFLREIDFKIA